jgi:hypothetical protein
MLIRKICYPINLVNLFVSSLSVLINLFLLLQRIHHMSQCDGDWVSQLWV